MFTSCSTDSDRVYAPCSVFWCSDTHTQYDESSRFVLIYTQYLKKLCIYCCLGYERHQQTAALSKTWLYKVLALALDHFWSCSSNSAALTSSQFSSAEYSIPSMYIVHSMLCSSIVVGIQAQPDSISLSQLYYDRSKGYLSSIIHNKNHNATRYFRAKLWLWLSLIQFFSPPRGIWLVASNMEYDGCRQLRYCCCAMLCQGWLAAARHFTRRALCTGASSSERPAKMISKTQARHHRREEGKPIKRPRVATSDLRERWAMCLRPGSST